MIGRVIGRVISVVYALDDTGQNLYIRSTFEDVETERALVRENTNFEACFWCARISTLDGCIRCAASASGCTSIVSCDRGCDRCSGSRYNANQCSGCKKWFCNECSQNCGDLNLCRVCLATGSTFSCCVCDSALILVPPIYRSSFPLLSFDDSIRRCTQCCGILCGVCYRIVQNDEGTQRLLCTKCAVCCTHCKEYVDPRATIDCSAPHCNVEICHQCSDDSGLLQECPACWSLFCPSHLIQCEVCDQEKCEAHFAGSYSVCDDHDE